MATYNVVYDYSSAPTLRRFALSNKRVRLALGPFGCLRGDVKIITEQGLLRIADIKHPMRVLSWDERCQKYVLSEASIPYRKGTDYLYRVLTRRGEFAAAEYHRVFCADHKYRQVKNLRVGDALFLSLPDHLLKSASDGTIIEIERLKVKEDYYDLHVFGTNNYVTEDGTVHHNSGKSSAMVMEIIRRAHEQKPSPDGVRRSRWAVIRNCYDDQTEILTEKRGWQLFKDLLAGDKVATLRNNRLVYQRPNGVAVHPYKGKMLGFEGENVDFLVTPDHKMWVSKRESRKKVWSDYHIQTAEQIFGKELRRVKRDCEWQGKTSLPLAFFELLGFWFAEGSYGIYNNTPRIVITQSNRDGIEYARRLLGQADINFAEWKRSDGGINFVLKNSNANYMLFQKLVCNAGKAIEKAVPQEILNAPSKHLQAFLKGYIFGDGSIYKGTPVISTGSKRMADQLQEIALKAGYVANVRILGDSRNKPINYRGRIIRANSVTYGVTLVGKRRYAPVLRATKNSKYPSKYRGWYKQDYDGLVYCVEMEEIPVYVRRKGKGFWCLRTYSQLRDTTIKTFHDWFPPQMFGDYRITDHSFYITKFPGVELEVLFRALDRPDQVSNLLSLELTGAWFNEAREIPQEIIEAMDARIGRYPSARDGGCSWYGIIMDTNPPDEDSYLYRMFEIVRPDDWENFKQPSGLSPHAENINHLPKNYYTNLAKGKDERYIRVYVHGQYGYMLTGKPVFSGFVDSVHVAPRVLSPLEGIDLIAGFDFGLQPCCAIGQITPYGQLRIIDELVSDGMAIKQFSINQLLPLLRQKYFKHNIMGFGDPAGNTRSQTDESTCFDVLHSAEIGLVNIVPAETNALVPRLNAVEKFLNKMVHGEPGFILSPNCRYLRKALNGGYHYPLEKSYRGGVPETKPMPMKNFSSHIADALEYLCLYVDIKEEYDKRKMDFVRKVGIQLPHHPATRIGGY